MICSVLSFTTFLPLCLMGKKIMKIISETKIEKLKIIACQQSNTVRSYIHKKVMTCLCLRSPSGNLQNSRVSVINFPQYCEAWLSLHQQPHRPVGLSPPQCCCPPWLANDQIVPRELWSCNIALPLLHMCQPKPLQL